jgi:hypothetical protein
MVEASVLSSNLNGFSTQGPILLRSLEGAVKCCPASAGRRPRCYAL